MSADVHPDADPAWRPMVALLHVRREHDDHVDWLLARDAVGAAPLWSFRAAVPPTTPRAEPLGLRLIADHRSRYLAYEGPISGDRGTVRRVAAGRYRIVRQAGNAQTRLELEWDGAPSYFVTISTKSPASASVAGIAAPPAEHDYEPVHWLVTQEA